ncbi:hypothetical protein EV363DRAFT_1157012 [Boletus edulis]|nr:hypothetical protein EV363DRAFT_1157012 [Boletus edulis]
MEYFPFYITNSSHHYRCIPYPTFAQLLTRLDDLHPNFGWQEKFTPPLTWLCSGNTARCLDDITVDWLDYLLPETLCIVFDIPPAWVLTFCEEALLAMECAREQAALQHKGRSMLGCFGCAGLLNVGVCLHNISLDSPGSYRIILSHVNSSGVDMPGV